MLTFQNTHQDRGGWELPGLSVRPEGSDAEVAKFDLSFSLAENRAPDGEPAGIAGTIGYSADLFERPTIEKAADRLVRVLEQVAADPTLRLSQVTILDGVERDRVVWGWNETGVPMVGASVVGLFEERVGCDPGAVAVVCEGRVVSYGEVEAAANRLAWRLAGLCGRRVGLICRWTRIFQRAG
jgi:non-ribosomal peptide synthetase component F